MQEIFNPFYLIMPPERLDLNIKADNSKGASKIFIGANRHYPDGFSILIDDDFVMYYNPLKNVGLETYKCPKDVRSIRFYLGCK